MHSPSVNVKNTFAESAAKAFAGAASAVTSNAVTRILKNFFIGILPLSVNKFFVLAKVIPNTARYMVPPAPVSIKIGERDICRNYL